MPLSPLEWLRTFSAVTVASPLEGDFREAVLGEEGSVGTTSGIELVNESLQDAHQRSHSIVIVIGKKGEFPFVKGFNSILMKDAQGNVCGFEVHSEDEKRRIDADDRYFWLSTDFAVDTSVDFATAKFVLPSVPFPNLEEATGVRDAVMMICSPSTVQLILQRLEPEHPDYSAFVISYN